MQRVAGVAGGVTYRAVHGDDGHADRCTAKALALRASVNAVRTAGKLKAFESGRAGRVVVGRAERSAAG